MQSSVNSYICRPLFSIWVYENEACYSTFHSFLKFTFMKNEFKHIFTRNFQVRAHFATKTKCNQYGLLVQTVYLDMNQKQLHGGKDTAPWAESTSYQKISWYIKIWQCACMCLEDLLTLKGWRIPQSHLSSEWESTSVDSYPYNN